MRKYINLRLRVSRHIAFAPLNTCFCMRIRSAIGMAIGLIVLRIVMPEVFTGLEVALVKFFAVITSVMGQFPATIDQTAMIYPHAVPLP